MSCNRLNQDRFVKDFQLPIATDNKIRLRTSLKNDSLMLDTANLAQIVDKRASSISMSRATIKYTSENQISLTRSIYEIDSNDKEILISEEKARLFTKK